MIDRSLEFWRPIIDHPDVAPAVNCGVEGDWLPAFLENPDVLPYRAAHGGYFLVQIDPLGRVWDLHAAFIPEGWGREAGATLKALLMGLRGWDVVIVSEVDGNWRSRPPRSFGFRPAADPRGSLRTWILTRLAWEAAPARQRMEQPCLRQSSPLL